MANEAKTSQVNKTKKARNEKEGILNFGKEMGSALFTALFFIIYVIQAFVIPTASMEKTLLTGDFLLGLKFMYGSPILPIPPLPFGIQKAFKQTDYYYWKFPGVVDPVRGDVVIFTFPGASAEEYIKRCVAVAGDTVQVDVKDLRINGILQNHPTESQFVREGISDQPGITNFAPLYIPKAGDTLDLVNAPIREFVFYKNLIHQEHPGSEVTELFSLEVDGVDYTDSTIVVQGVEANHPIIQQLGITNGDEITVDLLNVHFRRLHEHGNWTYYDYQIALWTPVLEYLTKSENVVFTHMAYLDGEAVPTYITKWESYFMMGDNRDNSADSRYWGFVNRNFISAKAAITYFSLDGDTPWVMLPWKIRWNRLGKMIRNWDAMPETAAIESDISTSLVESTIDTDSTELELDSATTTDSSVTVDSTEVEMPMEETITETDTVIL